VCRRGQGKLSETDIFIISITHIFITDLAGIIFCTRFVIGRIEALGGDESESCQPVSAFNWTYILKNDNSNQINCF